MGRGGRRAVQLDADSERSRNRARSLLRGAGFGLWGLGFVVYPKPCSVKQARSLQRGAGSGVGGLRFRIKGLGLGVRNLVFSVKVLGLFGV